MEGPPSTDEPRTKAHRVEHDWTNSRSVGHAVIEKIARLEGVDETDLRPLYDRVDPDALDALFRDGEQVTTTFLYEGYRVAVSSDGEVLIESE